MIFEYVYNRGKNARRGRRKVGMFLAVSDSRGGYYTSWSLCNEKAGDQFDRWTALMECNKRLGKVDDTVPDGIASEYRSFQERAGDYFQEKVSTSRKKTSKKK